jgi:hypothetical protein
MLPHSFVYGCGVSTNISVSVYIVTAGKIAPASFPLSFFMPALICPQA